MSTTSLLRLLKELSYKKGEVVLASGQTSDFYVDCRLTTLNAQGAYLVGQVMYEKIKHESVHWVGGLTLGADPIATAIAVTSYMEGNPINAFIVRKEVKDHGQKNQVEGGLPPNTEVIVVEDVITTGGSALKAINALEEMGCVVKKVVAIVDRQEGGRENLEAEGYMVDSIFTREDFLS